MYEIQRFKVEEAGGWLPHLVLLLQDAVDAGASVGFLAPLSVVDACQYWTEIFSEISRHNCILPATIQKDQIIGSRVHPD
jgi:hypothetical protein